MADKQEEAQKKQKKRRLGPIEIAVLIGFALFFDLLSIIPIVNIVVDFIGEACMIIFFYSFKVNPLGKRNIVSIIIGTLVKFVPFISVIPAFTLETIVIIILTRAEDKTGIDSSKLTKLMG